MLKTMINPRFQYQNAELFCVRLSVELIARIVYSVKLAIRTMSPTGISYHRPILASAVESCRGYKEMFFVELVGRTGTSLVGLPALPDPVD
jgi:hypothetical protein